MSGIPFSGFVLMLLIGINMIYPIDAAGQENGAIGNAAAVTGKPRQPVRTNQSFAFVANGRLPDVFPLFGAERERLWAPGWEPHFLWPSVPNDVAGMVFEVARGDRFSTWVNTVFDSATGRVQYVYVISQVVATVITIELRPQGDTTKVVVRYDRTSLSPESDAEVKAMAEHDRAAGPEWAAQINAYLARSGVSVSKAR